MIETSLDGAGPGRRAIALGSFDGVHLGHRRVIERTVAAAGERGIRSSVVTTFSDARPFSVSPSARRGGFRNNKSRPARYFPSVSSPFSATHSPIRHNAPLCASVPMGDFHM